MRPTIGKWNRWWKGRSEIGANHQTKLTDFYYMYHSGVSRKRLVERRPQFERSVKQQNKAPGDDDSVLSGPLLRLDGRCRVSTAASFQPLAMTVTFIFFDAQVVNIHTVS